MKKTLALFLTLLPTTLAFADDGSSALDAFYALTGRTQPPEPGKTAADHLADMMAGKYAAASPPVRVTFIMAGGLVLADSVEDAMTMELHADRSEVREAMSLGGRITVRSATGAGSCFTIHFDRKEGD